MSILMLLMGLTKFKGKECFCISFSHPEAGQKEGGDAAEV